MFLRTNFLCAITLKLCHGWDALPYHPVCWCLGVFWFLWHIIYYLLFKASWFHYYLLDVLLFSFLMKTSEKVRKKLKIVLDIKKLHLTYLEGVSIEREGLIKVVWYNFNFLYLCYFSSFFYSCNLYCLCLTYWLCVVS